MKEKSKNIVVEFDKSLTNFLVYGGVAMTIIGAIFPMFPDNGGTFGHLCLFWAIGLFAIVPGLFTKRYKIVAKEEEIEVTRFIRKKLVFRYEDITEIELNDFNPMFNSMAMGGYVIRTNNKNRIEVSNYQLNNKKLFARLEEKVDGSKFIGK